nr:hypothetical protein [Tanacetum cinerariifolium]
MNDRMMQSIEGNADSSKVLDDGLVVTKSNETESERHILSSRSGNDTHTDDADINSVNDKQPMAEVQLFAEHNILANEQQRSEQSASIYDTYLLEKVLKNGQHGQILNETSNEANIKWEINVLETRNIDLENSVARLLAENEKLNKENEHLKQTYKDLSDFIKKTSVQTKDHADSLIVQLNYKNSKKESYGSNDMAHNYYLKEAKKKTQDKNRDIKLREMPFAKTYHTPNACTPKPRSNDQTSRNWPASKSCEETL